LVLITTEKDHMRLAGDSALAKLASRAAVLPVRLAVDEQDQFRQLVLGAVKRN
jgi:tetraacyldisaccharide-1-P 4'-kinase